MEESEIGQIRADRVATDQAAAMAVAHEVDGIVIGIHVTGGVAHGKEAGDGLIFGGEDLVVVIDVDAAHDGQEADTDSCGIEGAFLDRG